MVKNNSQSSDLIAYWVVVGGSNIWLLDGKVPKGSAQEFGLPLDKAVSIGQYQGSPVNWINESDIEKTLELESLRCLLLIPQTLLLLVSKAVQYGHMTQTQRFCPQCGGRNFLNQNEIAMQCGECRTIHYPRISPCIIVAVKKGDKTLLAQHPRHKGGMYTVIAGFMEVGETLEQCVEREVKEETGINIKNIRYFGSQPWAFPSNLMIAFLADYACGDIQPDYTELTDVKWFSPEELPTLPPKGTIARELIDQTIKDIKSK